MLAKVIVVADTRAHAIAKMTRALDETTIAGIETNLDYLRAIAASKVFHSGQVATNVLASFAFAPRTVDVMAPGAQSGLQELPGRLHLWHVGVPPSGPMDECSFCLANIVVGNPETSAALELTVNGPTLRFNAPATIGLVGAWMAPRLDGVAVSHNTPITVGAGRCSPSAASRVGQRCYLACAAVPTRRRSWGRARFHPGCVRWARNRRAEAGDVLHRRSAKPKPGTALCWRSTKCPVLTRREIGDLRSARGSDFSR